MESSGLEVKNSTGAQPIGFLKDNIAAIVALMIIILGFAYLFLEIWFPLKNASAIVALVSAVVYFWYSSSPGSDAKNKTIDKAITALRGDKP